MYIFMNFICIFLRVETKFLLPKVVKHPPHTFIDGLQVPIAGRGVMSFANTSENPNCERHDLYDQLNSRIWYKLTEDLYPKRDGSLHEITIQYNNSMQYKNGNNIPPPIPPDKRKRHDVTKGFWPGILV